MTIRANSVLVLALTASLAVTDHTRAQSTDEGAWFAFAGQGPLIDGAELPKWRWWFDGHARFFDDSQGFETSIVRPGVGYRIADNTTVWLGYAWIRNDPPAGHFDEQRIWQQLTWGKKYSWGRPFLRTRLEQRFDERGSETGWRIRQFVRWTHPLGSDNSRLSVRIWDEVFIDLNDTRWGQDIGLRQNRAFAGLGWTVDTGHTVEFGYLNQHLRRDGARDSSNHILGITFLSNF